MQIVGIKMRIRIIVGCLIFSIFSMLGALPSVSRAQAQVPRFESADCPMAAPDNVRCGYLNVPEDRSNPRSRTLRLAVAIAQSRSENPQPDPVIYLHGGPSNHILWRVFWWSRSPFLEQRDVIVIDQRGTGYSQPTLDCPEMHDIPILTLTSNMTLAEATQYRIARATQCRERLTKEGIDLARYTTADSAADIDDLRKALGYKQWNLLGYSYGTRLALAVMRDYPDGVRSAILDSVYMPPTGEFFTRLVPNAAQTFKLLFDACKVDAACNAAYPDLEAAFLSVVDQLNAEPLTFQAINPFTDQGYEAKMNGPGFVGLVYRLMYDSTMLPLLPQLIYEVRRGNSAALPDLLTWHVNEPERTDIGMANSVYCYDEAPFTTLDAYEKASASVDPRFNGHYHWDVDIPALLEICKAWMTRPVNSIENQPVTSDIPTLVLAGKFDPASPPIHSQLAAKTLRKGFYVEFPTMGHFLVVSSIGQCAVAMTVVFVNTPTSAPDTTCVSDKIAFVIGSDAYVSPGVAALVRDINANGYTARTVGALVISVVGFGLTLLLLPLLLLRRSIGWMARLVAILVGAMSVLNLAYIVLVFRAVQVFSVNNPGVLWMGLLPDWIGKLSVAVIVSGLVAFILFVLLVASWIRRKNISRFTVVHTALAVLSAFALLAYLFTWNIVSLRG
jgi:pimeloyl-ACP methyl ester carboxylesterase